MKEIWYSAKGLPYPENEPNYYNVQGLPGLQVIEEHWPEIKEELDAFIEEKDRNFTANNYQEVKIEGGWNSLTFIFWGFMVSKEFYKKCPMTHSYLRQVKGLVSLSLSRLSANSSVGRHRGDSNAIIRCHLGIEIPAGIPVCGIKVREEERGWAEGKWTLFNDACIHSAWNNTDKRRIVLIADIIRPEVLKKERSISASVIAYQLINKPGKEKSFKNSSSFVKNIVFSTVFTWLYIYRPVQNLVKSIF